MWYSIKKLETKSKIVFILLLLQSNISCSQNFKYKNIPENYYSNIKTDNSVLSEAAGLSKTAYDLVSSLPVNCDKTGKEDYTDIVQKVLDEKRIVNFPDFPLLINSKGINISSDSKLIFGKNSKLLLEPNDKTNYEVIRIYNVKNVVLYFPNITGDRKSHIGNTGEWGMGISIRGGENVTILNPVISDCWGDGIYIGTGKQMNSNIVIKNALLDNNRRNGISVISVIGLDIVNPLISNTNGTRPMAGIDFEPNNNLENLQKITVTNPITFNNSLRGILFALNNIYGVNEKNIDVVIKNHLDDGSAYAMGFALTKLKSEAIAKKTQNGIVSGNIKIDNPTWKNNSTEPVQFYDLFENNIQVDLTNPQVYQGTKIDKSKMSNLKNNIRIKFLTKK